MDKDICLLAVYLHASKKANYNERAHSARLHDRVSRSHDDGRLPSERLTTGRSLALDQGHLHRHQMERKGEGSIEGRAGKLRWREHGSWQTGLCH
jgi:hypothetical protein